MNKDALFFVETHKDIPAVMKALEEAIKANGFSLMHTYDLKAKLQEKGQSLHNECRVIEVCNAGQAAGVLAINLEISLALPCRISVYSSGGITRIGTMLPSAMITGLFAPVADPAKHKQLADIASSVENTLKKIMQSAAH